ncbi:MAG: signal peptidase I [Acaryochloridaceae cyanobacterium SU_2_1]|nr:signal peptidase I [Acaryochloridaceae cyanobacterium SU_2_1]
MPQPKPASLASSKHPAEEAWWLEAAKTVGLSLLLAFGIRTFVAEARFIPSGSMEPTLQVHDRLIIDKVTFQFRNPERGEIVVFNPTQELRKRKDEQGKPLYQDAFIKRVIGVPGDQIALQNGAVFRNGQQIKEGYVEDGSPTSTDTCNEPQQGLQPFLQQPQRVPDDYYLVLGDNRLNSYDGRCWGLVARQDLVGRAIFRFWPLNRLGTIPAAEVAPAEPEK